MFRKTLSAIALGAAVAGGPLAAMAQPYGPPPAWRGETWQEPHHMRAFITEFDGRFNMTVRVHDNFIPVNLHQGTIIHPTGLTLHRGMLVRIDGSYNGSGLFLADRITLIS